MTPNVGSLDRALRAIAGLILIALPFITGLGDFSLALSIAAVALGAVMLAVAASRVCPVYSLLGIKTCA